MEIGKKRVSGFEALQFPTVHPVHLTLLLQCISLHCSHYSAPTSPHPNTPVHLTALQPLQCTHFTSPHYSREIHSTAPTTMQPYYSTAFHYTAATTVHPHYSTALESIHSTSTTPLHFTALHPLHYTPTTPLPIYCTLSSCLHRHPSAAQGHLQIIHPT